MELVEEPSVLRRFIRLLQEPFSRIKERWLSYFARLAMDDDPSDSSLDVESQSRQDSAREGKKDEPDDDGRKKHKSPMQNLGSSARSTSDAKSQKEERSRGDSMDKTELETHQPTESKNISAKDIPGTVLPMPPPAGRPKMMYKVTLMAMGATIGLGHLWRLPNMAYKLQTGNFIIIYAMFTLIFGFPLYFISLSCGQYSSQAALKFYERVPLLQGVGASMILYAYITSVYQMQMIGFGIHYLVSSFELDLPWTKCGEDVNGTFGSLCYQANDFLRSSEVVVECPSKTLTADRDRLCGIEDNDYRTQIIQDCCGDVEKEQKKFQACKEYVFRNNCLALVPPSMHFWNVTVVRPFSNNDPPTGILGATNLKLLLCSLGASLLVYAIVLIGFQRTAYISMFIIPLMFAALALLVLSSLRLAGSAEGMLKLITPDTNSLKKTEVWYAAMEQSLYSLGLGMCLVISIGSVSPFNNAAHKTALAVTFTVIIASLLSSSLVFAICGAVVSEWSKPFHSVFDAGLGTIYVAYSQALAELPLPWLFSCIFYALFAVTGACSLSSLMSAIAISVSEIINVTIKDKHVLKFIVVFSCFLLGVPITMRGGLIFIDALDTAAAALAGPMIVTLEIITLFNYGFKFFCEDTAFMLGFNPIKWLFPISVFFPLTALCIFAFRLIEYEAPDWNIWALATGFSSLGLIFAPVLLVFFLRILLPSRRGLNSVPSTGPKSQKHKLEREEFRNMKSKV